MHSIRLPKKTHLIMGIDCESNWVISNESNLMILRITAYLLLGEIRVE